MPSPPFSGTLPKITICQELSKSLSLYLQKTRWYLLDEIKLWLVRSLPWVVSFLHVKYTKTEQQNMRISGHRCRNFSSCDMFFTDVRPISFNNIPSISAKLKINIIHMYSILQSHLYITRGNRWLFLTSLPSLPTASLLLLANTLCFLVQFPSNCHMHRRTFAKRRR